MGFCEHSLGIVALLFTDLLTTRFVFFFEILSERKYIGLIGIIIITIINMRQYRVRHMKVSLLKFRRDHAPVYPVSKVFHKCDCFENAFNHQSCGAHRRA